jgi:hypothetical protein
MGSLDALSWYDTNIPCWLWFAGVFTFWSCPSVVNFEARGLGRAFLSDAHKSIQFLNFFLLNFQPHDNIISSNSAAIYQDGKLIYNCIVCFNADVVHENPEFLERAEMPKRT